MRKQLLDELQEFYKPGDVKDRLSALLGRVHSILAKDATCDEERAAGVAEVLGGAATADRAQLMVFETVLHQLPEDSEIRRVYREVFLTMLQGRVDHYSHLACRVERDLPDEDRCWPRLVDDDTIDVSVFDYERKVQTAMALLEMRLSALDDSEQRQSETEASLDQLYKIQVYLWRVVLKLCPEEIFPDRGDRWPLFFVPRHVESIPASKILGAVDTALEMRRTDLVRTLLQIVGRLGIHIDFSQSRLPSANQLAELREASGLGAQLVTSYAESLSDARRKAMEGHQGEDDEKCEG